ncbi:UDP-glycosyltransferase 73B5-like [Primulina tabacum]|uniref:UDP-glycosyltransferase 73B5-like n=1 Tax=Primulina tabacum TaxID=48773 RepID=UPI003F59FDDD
MEATGEILVLPFFGQGHLNPCVELCKYLSPYTKSRLILIIPSHLSSSIPSALHQHHPSIEVLHIEGPPTEAAGINGPDHGHNRDHLNQQLAQGIEVFLSERYNNVPAKTRPGCVVMDSMMSWCKNIFIRENIPIFSFFTSGAVSAATEHAAWKADVNNMKPGETRLLTGLPDCVALRYSDTRRRNHRGPDGASESDHRGPGGRHGFGHRGPGGRHGFGHREPGQAPGWLEEADDFKGLLFNTCQDLECPFLDYLANQVDKPVFGIGPLLPETYWLSTETFSRDRDSRSSNRKSNYTEDEVIQWLDSKPSRSVIYISFGSEVGPTMEEYGQLADALRESRWAFVWVIQPNSGKSRPPPLLFGDKPSRPNDEEEGYKPIGLQEKVGKRGMIIMGWAPQLLILSHPSTGGFLSHCGWNSSVEAIGRGVPILAWPIRGDQFYIAKLVVDYLKIGAMVTSGDNSSEMVKKSDILEEIDRLMEDKAAHERAKNVSRMFEVGLPSTSKASLKDLVQLLTTKVSCHLDGNSHNKIFTSLI